MNKQLVVSYFNDKANIALLQENRLLEIHADVEENSFAVGDLYIGKIKKLAPNLNAAFVNVGFGKDAFLHYHDLGPQLNSLKKYTSHIISGKQNSSNLKGFEMEPDINKDGIIEEVLAVGQDILIQITKEPISTKGPRISSELSLAGRFLVLSPFGKKVSMSKSIIDTEERNRLKSLIESIKPEGFGVILRTAAEGKELTELHADLNYLLNKWNVCFKNIQKKKSPMRVLIEMNKASAVLRDTFSNEFTEIICDDLSMVKDMKDYLKTIAPEKAKIVKYYDKPTPLFDYYNIDKQIKQSFGSHVNIQGTNGGYLIIEHTEALHVIDVNSGNSKLKKENQEESALQLNLKAATEIARQLRLRDMGGIIVVDFIDMTKNENKKILFDHFKEEMKLDKTKHKILPPSRFGLIQITRQRVRPDKKIDTKENNPNENGKVEAPILLVEKIEEVLSNLFLTEKGKLYIHLHPFFASYLTKGFFSILLKWKFKFKKNIAIIPRDSFKYLEIRILNKNKEELFVINN